MENNRRNKEILKLLNEEYYDAKPALVFTNPFELLIATILSAQSTDVQVNKVTSTLFKNYKSAKELMNADQLNLEDEIHSCGFFKTKAKNIIATSKILVEEYNSVVPKTKDAWGGQKNR